MTTAETAWFYHVGPEDAVTAVSLERLKHLVRQWGWDAELDDAADTLATLTIARDGRRSRLSVANNGEYLRIEHDGAARYPGELIGEITARVNDINGDPGTAHLAKLIASVAEDPAVDEDSPVADGSSVDDGPRVFVQAVSMSFTGAGMSDAQVRAVVELGIEACAGLVEDFEQSNDFEQNQAFEQSRDEPRDA